MCRPNEQTGGDKPIANEQIGGYIDFPAEAPVSEEGAEPPSNSGTDAGILVMILINRAIHGDQRAWREIENLLRRPLYQYIYHFTRNADLAEDLTLETLLKIHHNIAQFRVLPNTVTVQRSLVAWAKRIALNLCRDDFRIKKRRPIETLNEDYAGAFLEETPDFTESIVLWGVLDMLPADEKLLIRLRFEHEFTLQEIADMFDARLSTINSRIQRVINRLRIAMSEEASPANLPPPANQPANKEEKRLQKTSSSNSSSPSTSARRAQARGEQGQSARNHSRLQSRSKSTDPGNQPGTGGDTE